VIREWQRPAKTIQQSLITNRDFHSCHRDKTRFGMRDASAPWVVCTASAAAAATGNIGLLPPNPYI
jgi:hypothetical protein